MGKGLEQGGRFDWKRLLALLLLLGACKSPPKKATEPKKTQFQEETEEFEEDATGVPGQKRKKSVESKLAEGHFGKLPYKRLPLKYIPKKSPQKPNVVLIILDAINAGHMSAYGYARKTTPNLEKLTRQGIVFTNHISNSSWTRPSFTTIITGMTKKQHGVELRNRDVRMDITTIAEHFRMAGYQTAGFTGNPLTRGVWGFEQGYQLYEDTFTMDRGFPPDKWLTDRATNWLATVGDSPFFLKIFFTATHAPYRPLASARHFIHQVKEGEVVEYPFREYKEPLSAADHRKTVAAYDDEVRYFDRQLGELMKTLKKMDIADKTAIVVTGDHGEMFGEHGCYTHAYHMWEEALRVPLIIYLPWSKTDGLMSSELTTHVDIMPTLLSLAKIPNRNANQLHGRSIFNIIGDDQTGHRTHFSQYNAHGIQRQSSRKGRYKLIHYEQIFREALERVNQLHENIPHADPMDLPSLARALEGEHYEFYDLLTDPEEKFDLNRKMKSKAIYKELLSAMFPEKEETEEDNQMSPELIEALRNAGYIQ
ncbi:MAG: sulfatase [Deltaproteobacteria bacterium]|nr:sulfatase [Deltaproteobacteria bacterium]